jgi:tripartite-type tricarboxylate transporter receptor subunit TctC
MKLLHRFMSATVAVVSLAAAAFSHAANEQPVRIIVPFAAGGAIDVIAREMAQNLSTMRGEIVLVENRPGAAGTLASKVLLQAPPDGRTVLLVASGHAINELVYDKLPYHTVGDFTPIAQVADVANVLLVPKNSPYKTVTDVITAAKAEPRTIVYGTAGAGTSVHLAGELFKAMSGAPIDPVHYKGDASSLTDVMGGHIPLSFNTVPGAKVQLETGGVRALAVTSAARSEIFKDIPTIGESGISGYSVSNWFGMLGPKGMDPILVARLNAEIRKSLSGAATKKKLHDMGIMIKVGSPDDFDKLIRGDIEKWRPVINNLGLRGKSF